MAKDKSLKSQPKLPKRKKSDPDDSETPAEEIMPIKIKKKRKKMEEVEEAPLEGSLISNTAEDKIQKKDKKKQETEQTEIPDPPSSLSEIEGEEDLSPEERRVLERKMKKILKKEEKTRLKAEGVTIKKSEAAPGPSASQLALDYLTCWSENPSSWKFQKTRQTWLLQHMFDSEQIPDDKFSLLLRYLEGLQGRAKDTTVQKALSLVEESGEKPDDTNVQQRAQRAREIIQLLS